MKSKWKAKIIYNNLVFVCSFRKKMKLLRYRNDILDLINTIIKNNNEYLLTDTYTCYLSLFTVAGIINRLDGLKETNIISLLPFIKDYVSRLSEGKIDVFDEYDISIANAYEHWINYSDIIPHIGDKADVLEEIFLIIAAYVIIKHKTVEEYNAYIKDYIDNLDDKLDELVLQNRVHGFCYETDDNLYQYIQYNDNRLDEYLIEKIDDNYKKEIR